VIATNANPLSVRTALEVGPGGDVAYELDVLNERIVFSFGPHQDLMLDLGIPELRTIMALGSDAIEELERKSAEDIARLERGEDTLHC
jgi:hypothetical protein